MMDDGSYSLLMSSFVESQNLPYLIFGEFHHKIFHRIPIPAQEIIANRTKVTAFESKCVDLDRNCVDSSYV